MSPLPAHSAPPALWFTLELPKVRAVMRPLYQQMGSLPARDIDLISDVQDDTMNFRIGATIPPAWENSR